MEKTLNALPNTEYMSTLNNEDYCNICPPGSIIRNNNCSKCNIGYYQENNKCL